MRHNDTATAVLNSPVRRDILLLLSQLPLTTLDPTQPTRRDGMTAAAIGERLNLHVTTIRFHVDQLLEAGLLLARDVRVGVGRPRRFYSATPGRDARSTCDHRVISEVLADAWALASNAGSLPAVEWAARSWAARWAPDLLPPRADDAAPSTHAAVAAVVEVLEGWGLGPNPHSGGSDSCIELTACPFPDLAARHPELIAGLQRGLVEGILDALGVVGHGVEVTPRGAPGLAEICLSLEPAYAEV